MQFVKPECENYAVRQMTFFSSAEVLLVLISLTSAAGPLILLQQKHPPPFKWVSEGIQFVRLQCEAKAIKIAGTTFDWYHQNKWLYTPADSMRLVHNNTKTAKVAHLYNYSFFYYHARATYSLFLTIREVQASTNGLFTCRVNELSSRRKPYQIFLVVASEVSNLLMTTDGESPTPNMIFDMEEGEHIVQCTTSGFNYPNSIHLNITLLLGNESQKVTGKFQGIDMEAAVAAKADRFRASWTFTLMVDRLDTGETARVPISGFCGKQHSTWYSPQRLCTYRPQFADDHRWKNSTIQHDP